MRTIPPRIRAQINPTLTITYWCRRAAFEFVEEVAQAIFNAWATIGIGIFLEPVVATFSGKEYQEWVWWLIVGIATLLSAKTGIYEYLLWRNEVYLVALDSHKGSGKIYKFWGWPNIVHVSGAISPSTPTVIVNVGESKIHLMFYAVWRWMTGESMAKITLHSMDVQFALLNAQKVDPFLERAIDQTRGAKPIDTTEDQIAGLSAIYPILQAVASGTLDSEEGKRITRHLVHRVVYGEHQ